MKNFHCDHCQNLVFFENVQCVGCHHTLGFMPQYRRIAAFDIARSLKEPKPRVILFDTLMGKGVPFLEQRDKNHFIRVDPPEWQQALDHLDQSQ